MDDDLYDTLGPAFARIGEELAAQYDGDPNGLFLYVEIEEGSIGMSVFKDEGNRLVWIEMDDNKLVDLLFDAWCAEKPDRRWASMEYQIKNNRFTTEFKFPDEVNVRDYSGAQREKVLRARFGDKPVYYPPWDEKDGGWELHLNR